MILGHPATIFKSTIEVFQSNSQHFQNLGCPLPAGEVVWKSCFPTVIDAEMKYTTINDHRNDYKRCQVHPSDPSDSMCDVIDFIASQRKLGTYRPKARHPELDAVETQ